MKGYKAMNSGMSCRGFKFEVGKRYKHKEELSICGSGFHFCKCASDVFEYYAFDLEKTIVCEIIAHGKVLHDENKSVTNEIEIVRVIPNEELLKLINTGNSNTGNWNTGNSNTGNWNTGNSNTGDRNTGDLNTGGWNTGDWNTGFFNTKTPNTILVFGKKTNIDVWKKAYKPNFLFFRLTVWINYCNMTEDEKQKNKDAKTTSGYLKQYDYKESFIKSWENADHEDRMRVKDLPNFDPDIFFEISGIDVRKYEKE